MSVPLSLILIGCGAGPEVMLGTGESSFEEVADSDEILIIQGPQGGYHFEGALQAVDVEPGDPDDLTSASNPTITFKVSSGGETYADLTFTQGLKPTDDPEIHQIIGRLVILDVESDEDLDGAEVEFEVTLDLADGSTLTDSHTLSAVPHPLNGIRY